MRLAVVLVALSYATPVQAAGVLEDPRLASARAELQASFDAAAREGLPQAILEDKVREGLAKHVPPARIAGVVSGLEHALATARVEAAPHQSSPPPGLLKAIVEAHAAGAREADVAAVLRGAAPHGAAVQTRAIEVLTDLAQRGYPTADAARTVGEVAARAPGSLSRVPADAEALVAHGADRAQALDALGQADRGPNRESSGQRGPGGTNGNGRGRGRP